MTTTTEREWGFAHDLKIWTGPFLEITNGQKPYEVRSCKDRDFHQGDLLLLREWLPDQRHKEGGRYTGRFVLARVKHITRPDHGITRGQLYPPVGLDTHCVLGLDTLHVGTFLAAGEKHPADTFGARTAIEAA
jgi:hypothetical protein